MSIRNLILPILFIFASLSGMHPNTAQSGNSSMIRMTTSLGVIEIELYPEDAPVTVKNFIEYTESGFYDGTIFHRVIPGFMVQGGGFTPDMNQKQTSNTIENEADNGLKNTVGTLSMARTSDPNSATSQFFINVADNAFLDFSAKTSQGWGYAVFAKVTKGMEVVEEMTGVATGNVGGHGDVPQQPIVIENVEVISE
jgi:peptidyl-prolyl cis-trans isomerase B (cyclophilin B)